MKLIKIAGVLVVIGLIAGLIGQPRTPEEKAAYDARQAQEKKQKDVAAARSECESDVAAFTMANEFVAQRLKAPKSAGFGSITEAKISNLGDCRHQVSSYVDAQNSFGAMLRKNYVVIVRYSAGEKSWRLEKISTN